MNCCPSWTTHRTHFILCCRGSTAHSPSDLFNSPAIKNCRRSFLPFHLLLSWQRESSFAINSWVKLLYERYLLVSGEPGAMVSSTLKLGISILNGGNSDVQQVKSLHEYDIFMSIG